MEDENKSSGNTMPFLERMKQRSQAQKKYGDDIFQPKDMAEIDTQDCPNCGAGRAKRDGVTHCAYCGYEFIQTTLDDGIYITKEDNSRKSNK